MDRERRGGVNFHRDVVPRVLRVASQAWRSTREKSRTVPIFDVADVTAAPTVSAGSERRCVSETTRGRRARRLDVDPAAERVR